MVVGGRAKDSSGSPEDGRRDARLEVIGRLHDPDDGNLFGSCSRIDKLPAIRPRLERDLAGVLHAA